MFCFDIIYLVKGKKLLYVLIGILLSIPVIMILSYKNEGEEVVYIY